MENAGPAIFCHVMLRLRRCFQICPPAAHTRSDLQVARMYVSANTHTLSHTHAHAHTHSYANTAFAGKTNKDAPRAVKAAKTRVCSIFAIFTLLNLVHIGTHAITIVLCRYVRARSLVGTEVEAYKFLTFNDL